mmetsp:Transcript_26017/g.65556  ORF Transcript_26017/g.65556 Transcript_26017/m.65556 type:complete len:512 (-) Transcript_26017:563-2098(-)
MSTARMEGHLAVEVATRLVPLTVVLAHEGPRICGHESVCALGRARLPAREVAAFFAHPVRVGVRDFVRPRDAAQHVALGPPVPFFVARANAPDLAARRVRRVWNCVAPVAAKAPVAAAGHQPHVGLARGAQLPLGQVLRLALRVVPAQPLHRGRRLDLARGHVVVVGEVREVAVVVDGHRGVGVLSRDHVALLVPERPRALQHDPPPTQTARLRLRSAHRIPLDEPRLVALLPVRPLGLARRPADVLAVVDLLAAAPHLQTLRPRHEANRIPRDCLRLRDEAAQRDGLVNQLRRVRVASLRLAVPDAVFVQLALAVQETRAGLVWIRGRTVDAALVRKDVMLRAGKKRIHLEAHAPVAEAEVPACVGQSYLQCPHRRAVSRAFRRDLAGCVFLRCSSLCLHGCSRRFGRGLCGCAHEFVDGLEDGIRALQHGVRRHELPTDAPHADAGSVRHHAGRVIRQNHLFCELRHVAGTRGEAQRRKQHEQQHDAPSQKPYRGTDDGGVPHAPPETP